MKAVLRTALAQINVTVGDLAGNLTKINETIGKAKSAGAELVVFPELALSGYPPEDLLLNGQFLDACSKAVDSLSKKITDITAIVGSPYKKKNLVFNAAFVLGNKEKHEPYCKMHLPNYGVFDEKRYFAPGSKPMTYKIGNLMVGINICEDIWIEKGPVVAQKQAGADLIINLSASPFHAGKSQLRDELIKKRALSSNIPVIFTNLVGAQDELVFDGNSIVVDAAGNIIARGCSFKEDLVLIDIATDVPGSLQIQTVSEEPCEPLHGAAEIVEAIILGIRDYVRKNGFEKVLVGMSGGVDSSVVAALAVKALGAESVIGVIMPSMYSSAETQRDAQTTAASLGMEHRTISITPIYESYREALKKEFKGTEEGVAEENIQARIRGNLLMALANKFGWLVLSTGNKSETSVGYCTLYGDMAGGFAPIKDVPKTVVYEIARYLNEKEARELIPVSVIERAPSAELRPGQKDIDTLPPYEVLDPILQMYVEQDKPVEEIIRKGFDEALVRRVIGLVVRNEYKRRQAPPGVKITPRAFGKDRRFPITNKFMF